MKVNGQAVREARRAKGLSREELAVAVGVSVHTISRIERDLGDAIAGTAYLIAQELDVDLESLFTEVPA